MSKWAAGAYGMPWVSEETVPSFGVAAVATTRSPSLSSLLYPPHVPTLSKFLAPSCINSSATIEALGHPIPVVWTETGSPL